MKVTREQLREWYNSMTSEELCKKLGYDSPNSLYYLLRKAGIPLKGSPKLRKRGSVQLVDSE